MLKSRFQRVIALFLILSVPTFILKEYQNLRASRRKNIFSEVKPIALSQETRDKEFVVLVLSTAINEQFWERNINSLLSQTYEKSRVVYFDDGSSQRMLNRIENYLSTHQRGEIVTVVHKDPRKSLFDHYCEVVRKLGDEVVVVHLDGNDWLAHDLVIQKLNDVYSCQGVWLTYGGYLEYSPDKSGIKSKSAGQRRSSSMLWFESPLKTYYAKLFKQLDLHNFDSKSSDLSDSSWGFMLPMVQMAGRHVRYIPEVLYVHNVIEP